MVNTIESSTSKSDKMISAACFSGTIVIAALGLTGFFVPGLRLLGSVRLEYIPMAPSTAICFILMAGVMLCAGSGIKQAYSLSAIIIASVVSSFGLIKVLEFFMGVGVSFEEIIVGDAGKLGSVPIGVMSAFTGGMFVIGGIAAIMHFFGCLSRARAYLFGNISGVLSLALISSAAIFSYSYFLGSPLVYDAGRLVPPALTTSIAFLLLGIGQVIAVGKGCFPLKLFAGASVTARLMRTFPVIIVIALVSFDILYDRCIQTLGERMPPLLDATLLILAALITCALSIYIGRRVGLQIDQVNAKLSAALDEWTGTFDAIEYPVMVLDADFMIRRANRAAIMFFGMPEERVIGAVCYKLVHGTDEPINNCPMVMVKRQKRHAEIEMYLPGKNIWTSLAVDPLFDTEGGVKGGIYIIRDISDRKKAEEISRRYRDDLENAVREKSASLEKMNARLAETRRLADIGMLAATVAHELRNPLGVIKTAIYNIRMKAAPGALDDHLDNIDKKIVESDNIISNLLSYSSIKAPHYETASLIELMHICIDQCRRKYARWNVKIGTKFNCSPVDVIEADVLQVNELLSNIIDNACQALHDRSGMVEVSVDYDEPGNEVRITFRDNGAGIAEKDMPRIFEPFFTTKARGIGLGLTVCKQIVDLHGGRISFESRPGKGTVVTVCLPIRKPNTN